jgi:hypothetical protein
LFLFGCDVSLVIDWLDVAKLPRGIVRSGREPRIASPAWRTRHLHRRRLRDGQLRGSSSCRVAHAA